MAYRKPMTPDEQYHQIRGWVAAMSHWIVGLPMIDICDACMQDLAFFACDDSHMDDMKNLVAEAVRDVKRARAKMADDSGGAHAIRKKKVADETTDSWAKAKTWDTRTAIERRKERRERDKKQSCK